MFKEFDGLRYECFEDGECTVYDCIDKREAYDIPSKLPSGEIVTEIGDYAFGFCSNLESIIIPESVTKIGNAAFVYCFNLTSINIPESVTEIGNCAFSYCSNLASINIPKSVMEIGNGAFWNCSDLVSINIPESVTKIGNRAFCYCSSLITIDIPKSITEIGVGAFNHCSNLTSINIPESVTKIGINAFHNCFKLVKQGFFKATDFNMCCRDFQYELGKTYETSEAKLCKCGFHYCENAFDLFNYYAGKIGIEVRFFKVLPEEISDEHCDDSKRVCKKITFLEEIKSYHDLLN